MRRSVHRRPTVHLKKARSLKQRILIVNGVLLVLALVIVARLMELQIVRHSEFQEKLQTIHFGQITLPARRGNILAESSKNPNITTPLATNITLDLLYVDPLVTEDPSLVADVLSDALVTDAFHEACSSRSSTCPRELRQYYGAAYDPLRFVSRNASGALIILEDEPPLELPEKQEVVAAFRRDIEERISEKRITYVILKYNATKQEMDAVDELSISGISSEKERKRIVANPEDVSQRNRRTIANGLSKLLDIDRDTLDQQLQTREKRYVPIMDKLPSNLSLRLREIVNSYYQDASDQSVSSIIERNPLRGVAFHQKHWRQYPERSVAAHLVGFLDNEQNPQYGIERMYDRSLRGKEGYIATTSDLLGRDVSTAAQAVVDPATDGADIILTIDRFVQQKVEEILQEAMESYDADSAQAIVMDPHTGKILAMANAPTFDGNYYGDVSQLTPILFDEEQRQNIVVEVYHPTTNKLIVKGLVDTILTADGRHTLSQERQEQLSEVQQLYDLDDLSRYYYYPSENNARTEVFPTDEPLVWLEYTNSIGVGAYRNRAVQEVYEPGSVLKSISMAIAIDQGEVQPDDTYYDFAPVEVDEFEINNANNVFYGRVTMTQCLEFSINTCMAAAVAQKLGSKLMYESLRNFGFGQITNIGLDNEQEGTLRRWDQWSQSDLYTSAYGQGFTATPLQVIAAYAALANGGKLMKPFIIDSIVQGSDTVFSSFPEVVDQVVTVETAQTMTEMLVSSVEKGVAKEAGVRGYLVAGKTGTSQIARPGIGFEEGPGSTRTSFVGYAPASNPRFVVLVKFDRPRRLEFGSQTAAPTFSKIASFLFEYYGIEPQ